MELQPRVELVPDRESEPEPEPEPEPKPGQPVVSRKAAEVV